MLRTARRRQAGTICNDSGSARVACPQFDSESIRTGNRLEARHSTQHLQNVSQRSTVPCAAYPIEPAGASAVVGVETRLGVAGGNDCRRLDHENYGALGSACAVNDTFRDDEALLSIELDTSIFKIDDETTLKDKEELVVISVFVPVILTLHYAKSNDRIVHLAQRLVVPAVGTRGDQRGYVNQL
jgi:hypothetical protein